jgi:3-deoxy-7-phosphoheptulonate synthase
VETNAATGGGVVSFGELVLGDRQVILIAGPCAVESEEQLTQIASRLAELGIKILRGGAFKPRTSPYAFRGLGRKALEILSRVKRKFNLKVVTEVMTPQQAEQAAEVVDMIQVGARNMQNFPLLEAVAETGKPVLLKRAPAARLEELLYATEYILAKARHGQVCLCERGIRTFENTSRYCLDLNAVPILKRRTGLPVLVDPSHGTGDAQLVIPMALAAVACGADGIMVEVHPHPAKALSDGKQSLTTEMLRELYHRLRAVAIAVGREC